MDSYDDIVKSWGYNVLVFEYTGSYQGDIFCLLHDEKDGKYGFTVIGYGSCSGCDSLEACRGDPAAVAQLASSLHSAIRWWDADEASEQYCAHDYEGNFYGYGDDLKGAFVKGAAVLPPLIKLTQDARIMLASEEPHAGILADCVEEYGYPTLGAALRNRGPATIEALRLFLEHNK